MKRIDNIYHHVYTLENLQLADHNASKGKAKQPGVIWHRANEDDNILQLQGMLMNKTYRTSLYNTFPVYDPKERLVYSLPYFPHRVAHYAIMNILYPILLPMFTADTYACIKGRGTHAAVRAVFKAVQDREKAVYCLKFDIRKYYPSIDHDVLKGLLRRKIKDPDMLDVLDEIIDSADGLPIGNYTSQIFANLYLTPMDHWLKEQKGVWKYFRYVDDCVILSHDKAFLHKLFAEIRTYLFEYLHLIIKKNYQVFPVAKRGIDFCGYVIYPTHIRWRKRNKQRFARALKKNPSKATINSYKGLAGHAKSKHLLKKLLPNEHIQPTQHTKQLHRAAG